MDNEILNIKPNSNKTAVKQSKAATKVDRKQQNIKALLFYGVFSLFLFTVVNYFQNFIYSFIITALACVVFIVGYLISSAKNINFIRYLIFINGSLLIGGLSYVEGLAASNYIYLFIFLVILIFIFDFTEYLHILICMAIIITSLIVSFYFAPFHGEWQKMDEATERTSLLSNGVFSVLSLCILAFVSLRNNYKNSKSLEENQQFLDTVFNTSQDAVLIIDVETNDIINCNAQTLSIFEVKSSSELLKKNITQLLKAPNEISVNKIFDKNIDNWQGEMLAVLDKTEAEFPAYVSINSFEQVGKKLKKVSIFDITSLKQAQLALEEAKDKAEIAAKAKSLFLSNMSHELRTPLNGIIGTSNLLLDEASMPEQKEHFDLLKYSSEHMLTLINDVLDFSKIEAGMMELERQSFNGQMFIQKMQRLFQSQFNQKGIILELDVDNRLDRNFIGDETRLSQVLSNLLSNALKFTDEGKVVLTAKANEIGSKTAKLYFAVKDNGIGISKKQQQIIFQSFTQGDATTTRRFGGTGLGLAISKNIVELYNGTLQVQSEIGEGSTFYFTVDLDIDLLSKQFVTENTVSKLPGLENLKILIAEDNKINMLVARKFLKKWNINADEAENGVQAVDKFAPNKYHVLLIDLEMPEKDGYETVSEIRAKDAQIPIIAFTAAVYDNMQADLTSKGFSDYIQKPFRPEDLHRKLAKYVQN
jgi:PAS domain S-box-containing protein